MDWFESFMVKDVISILNKIGRGRREYYTSIQPDRLKRLMDVALDCPERPEDFKFTVKQPMREYEHICLTSGGADSTIAWYWAGKPQGLYVDIGQEYANKEIRALSRLAIPYKYLDMKGTHLGDNYWQHIIPGRNFLFLVIAAEMLQNNGNIWFAMVDGEGAESDKGDKSMMFCDLFYEWYKACTGREIYVQTMVDKTKVGWLKWFAERYDVDIIRHGTVTCFTRGDEQCGACQACLRKYLSFISIGIDTAEDYTAHPMFGAANYVQKYKVVMKAAMDTQDYGHYSRQRCVEDLNAISWAEKLMIEGRTM